MIKTLFKCYNRIGELLMEENTEDLNILGFNKNGDAVLDSPIIIKKSTVKTDPITGKKFIFRNGNWLEILSASRVNPDIINKLTNNKMNSCEIIPIDQKQISNSVKITLNSNSINKLIKLCAVSTSTDDLTGKINKFCQTDTKVNKFAEKGTQTEQTSLASSSSSSPFVSFNNNELPSDLFTERLLNTCFHGQNILDNFDNMSLGGYDLDLFGDVPKTTSNNDDKNIHRNYKDKDKLNFFMDLRNALQFNTVGNLPIHESIIQNNANAVKKNCIILRARRETPNLLNHHHHSALQLAIINGVNTGILSILLDFGADVTVTDAEGNSVFHLAVEYNRPDHMKILVEYAKFLRYDFDVFNHEGYTPLIMCCCSKSYNNARLLVRSGAAVNLKDKKSGRTPLFHAVENFDLPMVELLLEYNADTKIRNFFGTSAHDAMFEIDDMPIAIKFLILGRNQVKRKCEKEATKKKKKTKIETVQVMKTEVDL